MNRITFTALSSLILLGPLVFLMASDPNTVLAIDLAHAQVGQPDGKAGARYTIPPTLELTIDTRSFDFSKSLYPDVRPNAIQLLLKDRQYSAEWQPSGLTTLSASTLKPMKDSPAFSGLKAGDTTMLAIGEQRLDTEKHQIVLKALWVGTVQTK